MHMRLILAAALAADISIMGTPVPNAEAHYLGRNNNDACKNAVRGRVGLAVAKDKAKKRARRKWQYDVKRKHGYRFTSWDQAQSKDYHCEKKAGTSRCRAHAYPCDWQAH